MGRSESERMEGNLQSTRGVVSDTDDSSSDGYATSDPARSESPDSHKQPTPEKIQAFPVGFADLFKGSKSNGKDSSCTYIEPKNMDILEVESEDVDPIQALWGHCLLGCFAGRFPGLKAINNLSG